MEESKKGAPRKWDYKGTKKITSIRLSESEKNKILDHFDSIQSFIQFSVENFESFNRVIDTCQECGCTELLCGHNKRG